MHTTLTLAILTLAQAEGGPQQPSPLVTFLPMILLFAGFWFLIIAPQRKKQKAHEKMLTELKNGDEIVTIGGMFATITNVKEDRFVIRIADGTKVEITKSSVASRQNNDSSGKS